MEVHTRRTVTLVIADLLRDRQVVGCERVLGQVEKQTQKDEAWTKRVGLELTGL